MKQTILAKIRPNLVSALKVGVGSSVAVLVCHLLQLPSPATAGTITLLTLIVHTRKETFKLIVRRLISFALTVLLCHFIFPTVHEIYFAYALFLLLEVFILEIPGWQDTLSVNAVIAAQFLLNQDFSLVSIAQEFCILLISITIAFILNMIQPDYTQRKELMRKMDEIEQEMHEILKELSKQISIEKGSCKTKESGKLTRLKQSIISGLKDGTRYLQNSIDEKDQWIGPYFEMRLAQAILLRKLCIQCDRLPEPTDSSHILSQYLKQLAEHSMAMEEESQVKEWKMKIQDQLTKDFQKDAQADTISLYAAILLDLDELVEIRQAFYHALSLTQQEDYRKSRKQITYSIPIRTDS